MLCVRGVYRATRCDLRVGQVNKYNKYFLLFVYHVHLIPSMFCAVNQCTINANNRSALVAINTVNWFIARSVGGIEYAVAQETKVMYN